MIRSMPSLTYTRCLGKNAIVRLSTFQYWNSISNNISSSSLTSSSNISSVGYSSYSSSSYHNNNTTKRNDNSKHLLNLPTGIVRIISNNNTIHCLYPLTNSRYYASSSDKNNDDNDDIFGFETSWEDINEEEQNVRRENRNSKYRDNTNTNTYIGHVNNNEWQSLSNERRNNNNNVGNNNNNNMNRMNMRTDKSLKQRINDFTTAPVGIETPKHFQRTGIKLLYQSANLNNVLGVEQCELLLKRLLKEKHWYDDKLYSRLIYVDVKLYNYVISLWGKCIDMKNKDKVTRVLKVLELLKREEMYDKQFMDTKLSESVSLQSLSAHDKELYYKVTQPDRLTYTFTISALAKCGDVRQSKLYLKQLIQKYTTTKDLQYVPPVPVFGSILSAMAQQASQPGDGKHAYKMLQLMKQLHAMVLKDHPTITTDDAIIPYPCQPDAQSYAVVMDTYIKSHEPNYPDVVEKLLQEMIDEYISRKNINAKPDIVVLSIVIKAWAQASTNKSHAPKKAEKWLAFLLDQYQLGKKAQFQQQQDSQMPKQTEMDDDVHDNNDNDSQPQLNELPSITTATILEPTTECFNYVLNAYTQSNRDDAITRCEVIFQKFIHYTKKDPTFPAKPDTISFNTLINCYAKKSSQGASTQKIEKLLKLMEDTYYLIPDNYTYCTIFKYWIKSKEKIKVKRSKQLLDTIEQKYYDHVNADEEHRHDNLPKLYPPSNAVYTSVINVCTSVGRQGYYTTTEERKESYDIAKDIFYNYRNNTMLNKNNNNCDFYMYLSIFQALYYLLPNKNRNNDIEDIEKDFFRKELWNIMSCCITDNMVNDRLIKKLEFMLHGSDFRWLIKRKDTEEIVGL